jgi:hypothetical protein
MARPASRAGRVTLVPLTLSECDEHSRFMGWKLNRSKPALLAELLSKDRRDLANCDTAPRSCLPSKQSHPRPSLRVLFGCKGRRGSQA